jgi:hypothetical protein
MGVLSAALFALSKLSPTEPAFAVAWRVALVGVGTAIFISPNSAAVMSAVPPNRRGIAAATVATARNLGMALGVAQAGLIFQHSFFKISGGLRLKHYSSELEPFFMAAFQNAMIAGALVAAVGVLVAFFRGSEKNWTSSL